MPHIAVIDVQQSGEQGKEGDDLDEQGGHEDRVEYAFCLTQLGRAEFRGGEHALRCLDMLVDRQSNQGREGHDAKAAELDRQQNDRLPEQRPVGGGVDHLDAACRSG